MIKADHNTQTIHFENEADFLMASKVIAKKFWKFERVNEVKAGDTVYFTDCKGNPTGETETVTSVKKDHGINNVARHKDVQVLKGITDNLWAQLTAHQSEREKLEKDLRQLLIFLDSQGVIKMDDWFDFYGRANSE